MPQQLPFPTSNNAPLPIPGGYGNPTGANFGGNNPGLPFPSMPAYGSPNMGVGGAGGPSYNTGPYNATNLGGLNAGLMGYGQGYGTDMYNMLGRAYGKGTGQLLGNLLSGQLYNPQVAAAFLNAQQPGIARGEAGILGAFGNAGARFSSAAALGMGDYESQVQLNQQQTLAQMYEQAQNQELSVLSGVLPTIQQERANEGGWLDTILGAVETAGGVAIDAATMGTAGNSLIVGGVNTMAHGHGTPQGGGGGGPAFNPYGVNPYQLPGFGGNTGTFGNNAPFYNPNTGSVTDPQVQPTYGTPNFMQGSAGSVVGGQPLDATAFNPALSSNPMGPFWDPSQYNDAVPGMLPQY
jgi:hypothetical protein